MKLRHMLLLLGGCALVVLLVGGLAGHRLLDMLGLRQEAMGEPMEEACLQWAREVEASIARRDPALLDRSIHFPSLLRKALDGVTGSKPYKRGFTREVEESFRFGGALCRSLGDSGTYRLLRVRKRQGQRAALFRVVAENGLNYQDIFLGRDKDGQVRITDIYVYITGERMSEYFARMAAMGLEKRVPLLNLPSKRAKELAESVDRLKALARLVNEGEYAEAMRVHASLPQSVRDEKWVRVLHLQAAFHVEEAQYLEALGEFRRRFPNDPACDLVSLDFFFLREEYDQVLLCLDRLDRQVEGDPYLDCIRANVLRADGRLDQAEQAARRAIEGEPGLLRAYRALVKVLLERKDHAGTARILTVIERELGVQMSDLTDAEAYADFVRSPEYRAWMESRKEPASQPAEPASRPGQP